MGRPPNRSRGLLACWVCCVTTFVSAEQVHVEADGTTDVLATLSTCEIEGIGPVKCEAAQFFGQDSVVANANGQIRLADNVNGCEPFTLGGSSGPIIAVMQRGGCAFDQKVANAQAAKA